MNRSKRFFSAMGFGCLFGAAVNALLRRMGALEFKRKNLALDLILILDIFFLFIGHNFITRRLGIPWLNLNAYWEICYICVFLGAVFFHPPVWRKLESNILIGLNQISFGVYSLHWPIICSFTSICLLEYTWSMHSFAVIGAATLGITIICAVIYHYTVEKLSQQILQMLKL